MALQVDVTETPLIQGEGLSLEWNGRLAPIDSEFATAIEELREEIYAAVRKLYLPNPSPVDELKVERGPSMFQKNWPAWHLRETLLNMHGGFIRGHFYCDNLDDPKMNPPDNDVATPVIVEADPPR